MADVLGVVLHQYVNNSEIKLFGDEKIAYLNKIPAGMLTKIETRSMRLSQGTALTVISRMARIRVN